MSSSASPQPQPQQVSNNNSVLVIQLSSYGIRYDWNDLESTEPKTLINCMAIPKHIIQSFAKPSQSHPTTTIDDHEDDEVPLPSSSSSTLKDQTKHSFLSSTCEKQVMSIRGKILVDRKVLPENRIETDNYLEPVTMENSSTIKQKYTSQEYELSSFLVGKQAIDTKRIYPNDFVLYFPIKYGLLNCDLTGYGHIDENVALEIQINLLSRCIEELIQTSSSTSFSLLMIFSDTFLSQQLKHLKRIIEDLLTQFTNIENISIQKDSVMSLYGSGISHQQNELYTVDMGLTKTSIYAYQPNGRLASVIHYPYGGYDVYHLIMEYYKFEYDENVRKYCLTLKSNTHQETVQHLHNIYLEDTQEFASSISVSTDVFYIASNLYFNTKLLPSPKKKLYSLLNPTQQSKIASIEKYLSKIFKGGTGSVTICLTGGFSNIQFFPEHLKEMLKKKRIKILISNERDKLVPSHCTTWKGGVIITHIMNPDNYQYEEDDSTSNASNTDKSNLTNKLFFHRNELFQHSSQSLASNIPKFVNSSILLERTL
ncbi:predicted protein [Naegleria gruberi]|uniref:Predicted protein n=1 Tax=Naegleria gruberi TaxID=5762 RepID=D2VD65_NAEGR|nr:uncharacterized protein NAEGRDRAFT_66922 [Naegleria gruberi]EFC45179.1 predicted protein [Naegleria gruberi]|eukprot:XP_002677923.1 predicted protein [Naegleria gruberi strain NEG-M]